MESDYVVFTDESYVTGSRLRSIAALSVSRKYFSLVEQRLSTIIKSRSIKEFKWKDLASEKHKDCAIELLTFVIEAAQCHEVRIDVVVWDTQDARHSVQNRDDRSNFERMFYHLLNASMKRRRRGATWTILPDEKNDVDWQILNDCLNAAGNKRDYQPLSNVSRDFLSDEYYRVYNFREVHSHEQPITQVADLFAGLSVFSQTHYEDYQQYLASQNIGGLFDSLLAAPARLSNSVGVRCKVLENFYRMCRDKKMGVGLETKQRLYTRIPTNPLNFWLYEPQGEYDRAPTKVNRPS
ncbi:MAG: hypothetical protein U5L04_06120 [Trueperaceae bacterium]|nr:hypothetical protein [Trueperaceae bacterium]